MQNDLQMPRQHLERQSLPDFGRLRLGVLYCTFTLMAALQLFASVGTAASQDLPELRPGELVRGTLKRADRLPYRIKLEAGQSILIRLVENNIQLTLTAFSPDGEVQSASEISGGGLIFEHLLIVAETSGYYRVEVSCYRPGTFAILPQDPHATTESDRRYLSALKLSHKILENFKDQSFSQNQKLQFAVEKSEEKLAIYQALGVPKLIVTALTDIGYYCKNLDDISKANRYLAEALELLGTIEDPSERTQILLHKCEILSAMAEISQRMGDYQKALNLYEQSIEISRPGTDENSRKAYAQDLHKIGVIYHLLADEQKALEFYELSLTVGRSIISQTDIHMLGQGITLCNIGNLYRGIGADELPLDYFDTKTASDRETAIEFYKQALEISKITKNKGLESFALVKIGNTYRELGNYPEALSYLEPLIRSNTYPSALRFMILRSLGNFYLKTGEFQNGVPYYEEGLALLEKLDNNPALINAIASDYYAGGETQRALDLFDKALRVSRERERQGDAAASLFEIARVERDLGNFNNARNKIENAIEIAESLRARISVQDIRTTYFSTVRRYYEFYVDLLMQAHKSQPEKGYTALALQTSENSRSRSLLDLLTQAKIDIRQGVDPVLVEREGKVRERLVEKAYQQNLLLLGKYTNPEAEKMNRAVTALADEFQSIQAEIRLNSPRYAALTQPASLSSEQIKQLVDSGTVILEYALGAKKSYLWVVTTDSITGFDLAGRDEIEANAIKAYSLMTESNRQVKGENDVQRRSRVRAAELEYWKVANDLTKMLLEPAAQLITNKRLVIVPDGSLNYIPFAALPMPADKVSKNEPNEPLGMYHEVVTLPSASALALIRKDTVGRATAPKAVAIFADPVFDPTDSRARANSDRKDAATTRTSAIRDFERALSDVGLSESGTGKLSRLPFSRREADAIYGLSPKALSVKDVDFEASRQRVFSSSLSQYRFLHFATHGLLDSQHPELSGIVLSLVDQNGAPIDGFLRLQDIYNLKLNADLVVLSACNTALGKDVKGEGLIGLTRGFMYAGAPRVVASLWKVDDAATAELMSIFYKKMMVDNLRPAAALRAAQNAMMKQPRWRSPYYWAPFVLQGDWR